MNSTNRKKCDHAEEEAILSTAPNEVPPKDSTSAFYQVFRIHELAEQILIPGDADLEDLLERRLVCESFNNCICGRLESFKRENQVDVRKFVHLSRHFGRSCK